MLSDFQRPGTKSWHCVQAESFSSESKSSSSSIPTCKEGKVVLSPEPGREGESASSPGLIHTVLGQDEEETGRQTGIYSFLHCGAVTCTVPSWPIPARPSWNKRGEILDEALRRGDMAPEAQRGARMPLTREANTMGLLSPPLPAPLGNLHRGPPPLPPKVPKGSMSEAQVTHEWERPMKSSRGSGHLGSLGA